MPAICRTLFVCFLMSGICLAQSDNPFGGGGDGESLGDPFARPKPVRRAEQPRPKQQAVRPMTITPAEVSQVKVIPRRSPPESELRIRAALGDETTQQFIDTPLADAVMQLSATHKIPIVVDLRALEEIGLSADAPVTLSLKNVTLRSFLRLMLRELDLTYVIKDEVMQLTTAEAAEQNLVLEMYWFPDELTEKSDEVIKALTASVASDAWEQLGGPCTVSVIDNVLVVSATSEIHDGTTEFLEKLWAAFDRPKTAE